ncbi:MAG: ABC transporter permease [Dysgonamonadaceae bacterium]|jgi:ABC-2 type transport system permease protein|nr:ABC transporter permease [Dysgonamonadaceae bacterium]
MLKYLIEKEFKQMLRNPFIPRLILLFPLMVILVFPWAANQEITNINVDVVDNDHSAYSNRLTGKIAASKYFNLVAVSSANEEALGNIESETADVVFEIRPDFEKDLVGRGVSEVMISVNAVNIMKGNLGSNYMTAIIRDFADEIRNELQISTGTEWFRQAGNTALPVIQVIPQGKFNTFLDYKVFMIPALLVILLTLICGFLPALNIVNEKEIGTIEQINVTPVGKFSFILAKLIPYWAVGLVVFTVFISLAALIYGLIPQGNLFTLYFSASIYILVVSGLGLVISNHSSTLQQAMFVLFFFLIILIMISGLFTPIASMPQWAQNFSRCNPLRYFIEIMRMVYLKGSDIANLEAQLMTLSVFALILNGWAILSYRKSS